jgi:transcription initiation factor TFIID subunit 8
MPGILLSPSASSVVAITGMKRAHAAESAPANYKKRKVLHRLQHTQPVQHIVDPISAEIGEFGDSKDFFDQQLRRAIAIQCRGIGFEGARPDALEEFRALVDSCTAYRPCEIIAGSTIQGKANPA